MDCRNDHRHILGLVVGLGGDWNGFVAPMAPEVDNCTQIPMDPGAFSVSLGILMLGRTA